MIETFRRLLDALPGEELRKQLPTAIGEALIPLRLAPERALLALDIAIEFDLYEASDGVARLLRVEPTGQFATRAAVLATHPGSSEGLRDLVALAALTLTNEAPILARKIEMSMNPDFDFRSESERLALVSLWPGRSAVGQGDPPVVAITADAGPVGQSLDLALELRLAGARVRRLPNDVFRPTPPHWMSNSAVVVEKERVDRWWQSLPHLTEIQSRGSLAVGARLDLLQRVNVLLPRDRRLRLEVPQTIAAVESPFDGVEAFLAGAFRTHEMAFLTGLTRNSIARVCRRHPELAPREFRGIHYWAFPTLVGVRAWNFARAATKKRLDPALAAEFVRMSQQEKAVPVAVTASGEILMEVSDGSYSNEKGQLTSEVFFVAGQIRERFSLGGRRSAPDLLRPSNATSVNPEVYGGSPTVRNARVTVEAIERLARRAISDGMTGSEVVNYVKKRFPEVGSVDLEDALQVARQLKAVA